LREVKEFVLGRGVGGCVRERGKRGKGEFVRERREGMEEVLEGSGV
jgi:hypothetical protein